ncbi:MAG TPA: hypothetical protein VKB68_10580 [Stellaceae bacterium]|nr:hypothetical protein [Stellaceae bacterium]
MIRCLRGQLLAGAEADFEPDLVRRDRKQPQRIETAVLRELDPELR